MPERTIHTTMVCLLAVLLTVGFTAAPVAAIDGVSTEDDGVSVEVGEEDVTVEEDGIDTETANSGATDDVESPVNLSDAPVPEEACTDVVDESLGSVPWNDLPWTNDLPEEAQPPNLPADLVHPRLVASLVSGVTPNQCDVQDPNDPSYDPTEDGVDPDVNSRTDHDYFEQGVVMIGDYDATLVQTSEGPGASGLTILVLRTDQGIVRSDVVINDGEKDYAVYPELRYYADGTGSGSLHLGALNKRAGGSVSCDGEECHLDTDGTPAVPAPAVPAPTGQEEDDGGDDGEDAQLPEEICTDVGKEVASEVPWQDIPWLNDLPEEAQPEDVPTQLVGPWTIGNILSSGSVSQCDVQDPNDPSYDPREDDVDPDSNTQTDYDHFEDGAVAFGAYDATLDQNNDGPGSSGLILLVPRTDQGIVRTDITINDGEKDYAVNPELRYDTDGSAYVTTDVYVLDYRAGVEVVCDEDGCDGGPT